MMSFQEEVYGRLPLALQNVAVTAHGWRTRRTRYGSEFRAALRGMLTGQWRPANEWETLQRAGLARIVEVARRDVPYYRSLPALSADTLSLREMLNRLPLLEKSTVRENPEALHHRHLSRIRAVTFRTSGTTGTPLTVHQTLAAHAVVWAAMERLWRWAGVRSGDRRLSFTGNRVVPDLRASARFGRHDRANARMLMSVYHLGDQTIDACLAEIDQFQPAFVDGYPSAILACARRLLELGQTIPVLACFPTAETLEPGAREMIQQAFRTRVYNQYGSAEGAALITECPAGSLHVNPDVGIVEILAADGREAAPGEVGELVLTTLHNTAMPLIRYRIGDLARVDPRGGVCPCGRAMPRVGEVIGRQDDLVTTRDGRRIGMLSFNVFKLASNILASQIVQEAVDHFVLRVVPAPDFREPSIEVAVRALRERLGEDVRIDIEYHEELPRSANGKLRAVVSKVGM